VDVEHVHEHADLEGVALQILVPGLFNHDHLAVRRGKDSVAWLGAVRAGSRKNCRTNSVMIHSGIDQMAHQAVAARESTSEIARNGQPSRAMMGEDSS